MTASALWTVVGWCGNACFFSRFLVQWIAAERQRESVAPPIFWWISLLGSTLLGAYAVHTGRPILLAGFVINGTIYARNLWLQRGARRLSTLALWYVGIAAAAVLVATTAAVRPSTDLPLAWVACGLIGQSFWSSRFVLQWIASERRTHSHFPPIFWKLSLVGNALLLAYAIRLGDPVFIAGLVPGPIVQVRNLMLGSWRKHRERGPRPDDDERVVAAGGPVLARQHRPR